MAWELRGKQRYLYRKRRVSGRVVSEYCGKGAAGQRLNELAESDEEDAAAEHVPFAELEAALKELNTVAELLARGALVAAGFRQHNRGQWRRTRV
jgi:hypothetical protein